MVSGLLIPSIHRTETMLPRLNVKRSLASGRPPRDATSPQEENDEAIRGEC